MQAEREKKGQNLHIPPPAGTGADDADDADAAQAAAVAAAQAAESEELRQREEARAALLGLRSGLLKFDAGARALANSDENKTAELEEFAVQIEGIRNMGPLDGRPELAADELYPRVRTLLDETRVEFEQRLEALVDRDTDLPALAPLLEVHGPVIESDSELRQLRDELQADLSKRRQADAAERWPRFRSVKARLDACAQLHGVLLELASPELARRHLGFHDTAVAEARQEFGHLRLNLAYARLSIPRRAMGLSQQFRSNPVGSASVAGQIFAALLLFSWWYRGRKQTWLRLEEWACAPQAGSLRRALRPFARALPAIGAPLSWLALAYFLLRVLGANAALPGAELLWTLLAWALIGRAIVSLLHASAARAPGGRRGDPTAALRLRSLRLVGITVVLTGMAMTTTAQSVGHGTIYDWVISTCWFFAVPLLFLLTAWWKPVIFRRLSELQQAPRVAQWAGQPRKGLGSFIAAMVGGVYLFVHGIRRHILRRASHYESTRRILAYLVRREVARQALDQDESHYTPIGRELYRALGLRSPAAAESGETSGVHTGATGRHCIDIAPEAHERALHFSRVSATSITAIVGEAGGGKTHFLDRVCDELASEMPCIRLNARHGGWDELRAQLGEAIGLGLAAGEDELRERLAAKQHLIAIDDAHRLVRPVIGGLAELDRLLSFARSIRDAVSWLVVIEDPAWAYVRRGRGEGALFDYVARLPRWTEDQIGELLRHRSASVGVDADFSGLEVPRQATDDDLDEEERCEVGYYRILWDYVDGNPSLALHWWRESLFVDESGTTVVRLFQPPRYTELESLPPSIYFVLRAVVQLDGARSEDIRGASQLPAAEVENALRYLMARNFVETRGGRIFLTLNWFRAVTRVLWRRHLIIRSAA
jgi:hypothetical protein